MKPLRPLLAAALVLALFGCASKSNLPPVDPPTPLAALQPAVTAAARWTVQVEDGSGGQYLKLQPLALEGRVYASARKGAVLALDGASGARLWRAELPGPALSGPGDGGDLILVGSDAEVVALEKATGALRWRGPVSSEVLARPVRVGEVVVVNTLDGYVHGLNAKDGSRLWRHRQEVPLLSLRGAGAPVPVGRDGVLVGFANAHVAALGLADGKLFWQASVAVPRGRSELERMVDVDAEPQVADGAAYAVSYQGRLTALSLDGGRLLWSRDLSSYSGLTLAGRDLYVTDARGDVWGFARQNGGNLWKQTALHGRRLSAPAVQGEALVVADYEGYVHWLARDDGRVVGRARVGGEADPGSAQESAGKYVEERAVLTRPAVAGDMVYAMNAGGTLTAFQAAGR